MIRFFTANDEQILKEIPALASRFTATYHFALPSKEVLCTKIDMMMQYYGPEWKKRMNCHGELESLCERAVQSQLSFRDLTNYVIRFLFPPLHSINSKGTNETNNNEHNDQNYQPLQRCLDDVEWAQMMNLHATNNSPAKKEMYALKRKRSLSVTDSASEIDEEYKDRDEVDTEDEDDNEDDI